MVRIRFRLRLRFSSSSFVLRFIMLQSYEEIRTHANYFAKKARAGGRHLSARHVPDISQLGGMYLVVTCMHFRRRSGVVLQLLQCYSSF